VVPTKLREDVRVKLAELDGVEVVTIRKS